MISALRFAHFIDRIIATVLIPVESRVDTGAIPIDLRIFQVDLFAASGMAWRIVHDSVGTTDRFIALSAASTPIVARVVQILG
uniref:Putative secreted protein n=1 Tax=Anopheles darlingi TaxID=43151 RepID=A0A2M4D603_ANODA